MATNLPPCPKCGRAVMLEETDLRNGWHIGCYQRGATPEQEHYVGVTGATPEETATNWRREVAEYAP